ncbi:MAG: YpmA family protein [Syntrophomonadaceae bacterium]|nr:YpmA family protein [Syntrophomonadaceae bacterium]
MSHGSVSNQNQSDKLQLVAHKSFKANDELVKIVDFLNKNLKSKKVLFGLTKNKERQEMTINIYEI